MPRKRKDGRGGAREGRPGTAYSQRSDLAQAPRALPSKTYGDGVAQIESQRAAPLPAAPAPGAPTGGTTPPGLAGQDLMSIVQGLPGLTSGSQRPGEPLTAGLPFGPGAGPDVLAANPQRQGGVGLLRRMLADNPDPELFALIAEAERAEGGMAMLPQVPGRATGAAVMSFERAKVMRDHASQHEADIALAPEPVGRKTKEG